MNATEMMDAIDKCVNARETKKQTKHDRDRAELIANCKLIVEQLPKLREIRPVVMRLFADKLVQYRDKGVGNYNDWMTDGVNHGLGFFSAGGRLIDFSKFGIEGGGCWYDSVCVDIDTGLFSRNGGSFTGWDNFLDIAPFADNNAGVKYVNCAPIHQMNCDNCEVTSKIAAIAKGIDKYINKLSDYVASLHKKNKVA